MAGAGQVRVHRGDRAREHEVQRRRTVARHGGVAQAHQAQPGPDDVGEPCGDRVAGIGRIERVVAGGGVVPDLDAAGAQRGQRRRRDAGEAVGMQPQSRRRRLRPHQRQPRMRALPGDLRLRVDDRPAPVAGRGAAVVELQRVDRHAGAGLDGVDEQRGRGAGEIEVGDRGGHAMGFDGRTARRPLCPRPARVQSKFTPDPALP